MSLALGDTAHSPDNNENDTPPHTSKRPTPRASGVFFGWTAAKMPVRDARPCSSERDAEGLRGRGSKKGEAALEQPMKIPLAVPDGRHRSVRCEISWGLSWQPPRNSHRFCQSQRVWQAKGARAQPHFESPQLRHVMQPSIMTTATVLQRPHSCAPSGKCGLAKASACRVRAWNSARFSSTSFC